MRLDVALPHIPLSLFWFMEAPELIENTIYTRESDVYAFGQIIYQVSAHVCKLNGI